MKKLILVLLSLVPVIYGYIFNFSARIPILYSLFYYVLSSLLLVFWFMLGKQYSKTNWNWFVSLFISHFVGFISIILYFWQFYFVSGEARNIFIAGLSQMYTSCTYLISGRIAAIFQPENSSDTSLVMSLMQIIGLVLMITIFLIGYFYGKKRTKKNMFWGDLKNGEQNINNK